jgi:DNA repair protein RadA/Sms
VVGDPSLLFLIHREGELPAGIATAAVLEGSRTLLVEIQALTVPAKGSMSRVFSDRIDSARVSRIAATLEKHLGLRLSDHDLYINVAGGIRIAEVGVELALGMALYSARTGIPLPAGTAIAGELSLAGEVRPVRRLAGRIKTARNLGFTEFLGPVQEGTSGEGAFVEGAFTEGSPGDKAGKKGPAESRERGSIEAGNLKSAVKALFSPEKAPGESPF